MRVEGRLREKVVLVLFFPWFYLFIIIGEWYNSKQYLGATFNFKELTKETFGEFKEILLKKRVP